MPSAGTLMIAPLDGDSNLFATDLAAPWGSLRKFGSHTTCCKMNSCINLTDLERDQQSGVTLSIYCQVSTKKIQKLMFQALTL